MKSQKKGNVNYFDYDITSIIEQESEGESSYDEPDLSFCVASFETITNKIARDGMIAGVML